MKKILSFILLLSLTILSYGQDARQRTVSTIVADVLAQMPAKTADVWAENMTDLAASAPESVTALAAMLVPSSQGSNNLVEYAITGVAAFASDPANGKYKKAVREALESAVASCTDTYNKQFLQSQLRLLSGPEADPERAILTLANARFQIKSPETHLRTQAAEVIVAKAPEKEAAKVLASALKTNDRPYRNSVISFATSRLGVEAVEPILYKKLNAKSTPGYICDVINWTGNNGCADKIGTIVSYINNADDEVACTAIAAAGKIVSKESEDALFAALSGNHADAALKALKSYNGDIESNVAAALETANAKALPYVMNLASSKHMVSTVSQIFTQVGSSDAAVKAAALSALKGVVSAKDAPAVAGLLDKADDAVIPALQTALKSSVSRLSAGEQYTAIRTLMDKVKNVSRFYPALASSGTDDAVEYFKNAYAAGDSQAIEGLKAIDNFGAAASLLNAAKGGDMASLKRYVALVSSYEKNLDKKRYDYAEALNLASDAKLQGDILAKVGAVPTMKAFILAGKYLDNASTAYAAANAVKSIANATKEEIDYNTFKTNLEKAKAIFAAAGGADDGYAVDEISKMILEAQPSEVATLTPEEIAEGFEMLFDGTDLSKWQGDMEGYVPMNGTIYVSAQYGSTGNLYTKKEYKDFVFRFEFCFLREGVNNGVGIRTPMGVDAAYDAMCECQILDHDAPMYAGLREYQVHGSVYGVVPAKRIVHKPLGEWSTEEIIVKGDNIKVTVNGEVIVDANIRKACKGHNVAPDGSSKNPYTVDHKNHPGMFNKQGYISFCGHGEGLKLRNIRVKEL